MIGERLAKLRRSRGISQRELGDAIAVSSYTISSYELGRSDPSDAIKIRLAQYFDVSTDYLVGLIDEPYSYNRDRNVLHLPDCITAEQQEHLRIFLSSLSGHSAQEKED